jgi:two-component system NtrC family response regulator
VGYYRLDGVTIELPLLKDRGEDVLIIAHFFLRRYAAKIGKEVSGFTQEAVTALQTYSCPGNIRELINRIRWAVVMTEDPWVTPENLGLELARPQAQPLANGLGLKEAVAQFQAQLVTQALKKSGGNVQLAALRE